MTNRPQPARSMFGLDPPSAERLPKGRNERPDSNQGVDAAAGEAHRRRDPADLSRTWRYKVRPKAGDLLASPPLELALSPEAAAGEPALTRRLSWRR